MHFLKNVVMGLGTVIAAAAAPADAAIVNLRLNLIASDFTGSAPIAPVIGDFTFSFDNAASFDPTSDGLTVNSFNLPHGVKFSYIAGAPDLLILSDGSSPSGCGATTGTNRFCTFISGASTAPRTNFFYYSTVGTPGIWEARTINLEAAFGGAVVPEPATWAMMIGGFAMIGAALRRRRISTTISFA